MKDDEKKLGDYSRPDSVVMPADRSDDDGAVRPPGAAGGPVPFKLPPEPEPTPELPASPPAPPASPAQSPAPASTQPVVDSWDGSTPEPSWDSTRWDGDEPVEPVFQAPPRAESAAAASDGFDDPRNPDSVRREGVSPLLVALLLLGVIGLSVLGWWWFMGRAPQDDPADRPAAGPATTPPSSAPAVAATEPPPRPELPPLDASDAVLRPLVNTLSDHPQLAKWLVPDDLIRRFVATVDNISRGESPRPHLGVLDPEVDFEVARSPSAIYAAPESSRRYDLLVEVFTSIDIAEGARLYHDFEPLFEEAYEELGDPTRDFRGALATAIDHLLAVPIPDREPELVKGVLTYRYADPALEDQSPAAKHLLRLGRDNARKVQQKLGFLRAALDLPESAG
ncbi:MAG: DUF3014 domain-containing protein [Acidobacteriota bacterium]